MAFTATIEGLGELRERLSAGTIEKKLVKAVGSTALQLHNLLTARVAETYTTRRSLNSVLNSKTTSDFKRGVNFIEFGLEYDFKPILLQDFTTTETSVKVKSLFKAPNRFGYMAFPYSGYIKRKKANKQITVRVKRNGSPTTLEKGFFGKLPSGSKKYLMARFVDETWVEEPSEDNLAGERDEMGILFGPSLSQMAEAVFKKDSQVSRFKNSFGEHVMRNLEL